MDRVDEARRVHVASVAELVGLQSASERSKYECPSCGSSDALHVADDRDRAKCYSCGESWDGIGLYQIVMGVGFRAAVSALAGEPVKSRSKKKKSAPHNPQQRCQKARDCITEIWNAFTKNKTVPVPDFVDGNEATTGLTLASRDYLRSRGLDPYTEAVCCAERAHWRALPDRYPQQVLEDAGLVTAKGKLHPLWSSDGWKEWLLFPYFDEDGLQTFRMRRIHDATFDDDPKIVSLCRGIDPAVTQPQHPFGWPDQFETAAGRAVPGMPDPRAARRFLYVVEGELDAMSLWDVGRRAIGIPGTGSWRAEWCADWNRLDGVIVLADGDEAGQDMGGEIAVSCDQVHGAKWSEGHLSVGFWPPGKDTNDYAGDELLNRLKKIEAQITDDQ